MSAVDREAISIPEISPGIVADDVVRELARKGVLVRMPRSVAAPNGKYRPPTLRELTTVVVTHWTERGFTISDRAARARARELLTRSDQPRWLRLALAARRAERRSRGRR